LISPDKDLVAASLWSGEPDQAHVYHHTDTADRSHLHGSAEIDIPESFTAGSSTDVTFRFTIGETHLSTGSALRIAWRWPFDWADLQRTNPAEPNHLSVKSPEGTTLTVEYEKRGNLNPWHHDIDLRLTSGKLALGDRVEVVCSRWDVPTFTTVDGYFLMIISPAGDDEWIRLEDPPRFAITPGQPSRLIAISPADGCVGESATIRVRAVDAWENATPIDPAVLTSPGNRIGEPELCKLYPVWEYPVEWGKPGIHRIQAELESLNCTSNPTRVGDTAPEKSLYWGDLHAGQSEIGCGAGSLDNHYAFARDVAALQFASQQANDHYITRELWDHVRTVTPRYNVDGKFLAYLGCEWSPYTEDGGDRNVIYVNDEPRMRRSDRFFREHDADPEPDLRQAPEFLDTFRKEDVLLNLHVGGRPTNLDWHAPEIEPLFEVHSTHATSEWFLFDALDRGYKVGVTAGSDGVMGRPGACGSGRRVTRNVRSGLTAVVAESLTQRAVANGFFARHCYGTTGARLLVDVSIDGNPMGSEITLNKEPEITVEIEGTTGIERIDLFRGTTLLSTQQIADPHPLRYRLLFGGAREIGTAAAQRQLWSGTLRIENGTLGDIENVNFQSPLDRATLKDGQIALETGTAGNDLGFTFAVDGTPDTTLHVDTNEGALSHSLSELDKAKQLDCGGVNKRIELGPAPSDACPLSVTTSFIDSDPPPGPNAYWIRITQTDRHRAWTSPIYVTMA